MPFLTLNMSVNEETRFQIMTNALTHYKQRIQTMIEDKKNKTIRDILDGKLNEKLELIDEMIPYYQKNDIQHIRDQWDRYQHPLCLSLRQYVRDLEKSLEDIRTTLGNASPNLMAIEDELRDCRMIIDTSCADHFQQVDNNLRFPPF